MSDASIIVCTRNRAESLSRCLLALQKSMFKGSSEIVVVDNGSTDDTSSVVDRFGVNRIWVEKPNKSEALNAAVEQTESEYVLFVDDDVMVDASWVYRMIEPLEHGGHAVVGQVIVPMERRLPWMTGYHLALMAHTEHFEYGKGDLVGSAMALHRRVFATIPSFDPEVGPGGLGFGEDTLFSAQVKMAHMRIAFAQQAVGYHWFDASRLTRAGFLERAVAQGRSQAYLHYHWLHEDRSLEDCEKTLHEIEESIQQSAELTSGSPKAPAPPEEIELHNELGRCLQYPIEMARPRNYRKCGLQKIDRRG